jgi:hypothetical protein
MAVLIGLMILVFGVIGYLLLPSDPQPRIVSGIVESDETWSGLVHVEGLVSVPAGVKLAILPGTFVEFRHFRGYKTQGTTGLSVDGGTIEAIGTEEEPIWFTSDAEDPINGDWGGISCMNSEDSVFEYVIVEFGMIGIEQFNSSVDVKHSIVRWCNTEGLYSEQSDPVFESNLLYSNAYHDIALEQYNHDVVVRNNIFKGGHTSVHAEASEVTIDGNYFVDYSDFAVTGGQFSNMTITNNIFENITKSLVQLDITVRSNISGNIAGNQTFSIPDINIQDIGAGRLDYIPGDPEDRYMYVYDMVDETRRIVRRLDNVTDFGWSLTHADGYVWRFNHRSFTVGDQQDFVRIDPVTQDKTFYGNNWLVNPRALCHDGTYFWAYDFTLHTLYKFSVNSGWIVIEDSIYRPGLTGLTTDGTYLFAANMSEGGITKLDMSGNFIETIQLSEGMVLSLTWTGTHFWADSTSHFTKWLPNGTLVGKIYAVALEATDISWDGLHLWSTQKTCELWDDGKVFEIEILDDQFLMTDRP